MKSSLITVCLCIIFFQALYAQQTEVKYLSGTDKDNTKDWQFHIDRGMNSGKWGTIAVPSNWETQGYGVYNYGRGEQPESDETGTYRYQFSVPSDWKKKAVNIVFEGVMTDAVVKINGKQAGPKHRGGFYEFKYDISHLLRYGSQNDLEVQVKNWSDNESVNKAERHADFWVFGGIYRPVYLEAKPNTHIERVALDARANGQFAVDVYLNNVKKGAEVKAQITTLEGKPVGLAFSAKPDARQNMVRLQSQVDGIETWTPEYPNLYLVQITLSDGKNDLHTVSERFGFRTVELRVSDGLYVNDVKVVLKGVNRHSFWPESGRTTSKALSIQDVQLMKDMNMNAVRMSHYPPDKHFLDVCDSLGLFVLDELTGWQDAYDTEVGEKLVKELVVRDVNHPSIILWDNGNEGGWNYELDDDFHLYDPQQRHVIHPWQKFNGTDTHHYKDYNCCPGMLFQGEDVFFPTEFLHGLYDGGHGAGLDDYWKLIRENPLGAGGFLWVFSDEGLVRIDRNDSIDTNGSNAPDGIVGPYREKEGSYYAIKAIWSPVVVEKKFLEPGFSGLLNVENRYHFTNLDECSYAWSLVDFPAPGSGQAGYSAAREGQSRFPNMAPGQSGHIQLDLPNDFRQHDALQLKILDRTGHNIVTYTWPLKHPAALNKTMIPAKASTALTLDETDDEVTVSAGKMEYVFDKSAGALKRVVSDGQAISFNGGPVPVGGDNSYKGLTSSQSDTAIHIVMQYEGAMKEASYHITSDGLLHLDYAYVPRAGFYDNLGISFNYPEEKVRGVRWLGQGPYRVWKNRMKGQQFSVWEKEYNNTVTGESWVYPEFKGYHADMYWARIDNTEKPFTIYSLSKGIFLRLYTPESPKGGRNDHTDGVFPEGDISFLHAISPIGTKFKNADRLGPQSQRNIVQSSGTEPMLYRGTLVFDFR
jgi:hypothetical protein